MKRKSIIIAEEVHNQIKKYCDSNNLKLSKTIERIIVEYIRSESGKTNKD